MKYFGLADLVLIEFHFSSEHELRLSVNTIFSNFQPLTLAAAVSFKIEQELKNSGASNCGASWLQNLL